MTITRALSRVNVHVVGQGLHHFGFGSGVGPLPRRRDVAAEKQEKSTLSSLFVGKRRQGEVSTKEDLALVERDVYFRKTD